MITVKTLFKLNMIFSRLIKDDYVDHKPYEVLYVSRDLYKYHNLKDRETYKGVYIKEGTQLSSDTIVACYFGDKSRYE